MSSKKACLFAEPQPSPPSLEAETQKGLGWSPEPRGVVMVMGCRVPALTTSPVVSLVAARP